jgi:rubrerythrin
MRNIFSGSEIVEMAVQIEKNGRDFYNKIAKLSKNKDVKKIFKHLARQEERHIKVFEDMRSVVKKYEPAEAYTDEYFGYIKALSDEYIFTKKSKGSAIAGTVKDEKQTIELGIVFEKDSILFYHEMKNFVPEAEYNMIQNLLKEEQRHLEKLVLLERRLYA